MQWTTILSLAIAAAKVNALLRFSCSQLVTERLDPLVNPGLVGTPHLHQVVGGNAFAPTMEPDLDIPSKATCTSCTPTEDFSNYWTQVLFFRHSNGSFSRVPQVEGQRLGKPTGGMTVYYIQGSILGNQYRANVTAMRKGFRMLTGDPTLRTSLSTTEFKALSYRCYPTTARSDTAPPGGAMGGIDSNALPTKQCPGGIRSQVYFPTCWDGKNLDSPDHKSHVAYFGSNGRCPTTHPTQIPQVLYETIWDTGKFNSMWKSGDPNPFVWSMGDKTGFGQHADYLFGWQGDALQRGLNQCFDLDGRGCTTLKTQSVEAANKCTIKSVVGEQTDGWLSKLPGDVVIA